MSLKTKYIQGINDAPSGVYKGSLGNLLERQAYILGWNDYVGDNRWFRDYQTEEEILERILSKEEKINR